MALSVFTYKTHVVCAKQVGNLFFNGKTMKLGSLRRVCRFFVVSLSNREGSAHAISDNRKLMITRGNQFIVLSLLQFNIHKIGLYK